jgi:uncharacterized cupredoxin-like copper-binding protein
MCRTRRVARQPAVLALGLGLALLAAACEAGTVPPTPPITPGLPAAPREVNVIARDFSFDPPILDLVPGETVLFHVVNAGLAVHEAVIGGERVQAAWEAAEAATVGHPPGPTPAVSVPPEVGGLRVVVESGERVDRTWEVPVDGPADGGWVVGCHIPGHWAAGMVIPVRWVGRDGRTLPTTGPAGQPSPAG